jgi:hypothetical protein
VSSVTHWYLSFAGRDGFLGAVVVEAPGANAAILHAKALGCAPSDDVAVMPIPPEATPDPTFCNRLLTKAEVERFAGPLQGPLTAEEIQAIWRNRVTRGGELL